MGIVLVALRNTCTRIDLLVHDYTNEGEYQRDIDDDDYDDYHEYGV